MKRQTKKRRVATLAAALAIPTALLSTAETFVAAQETAAVAPSDAETSFAWDDVANLKAGDRKTLEIGGVEFAFRYCPPGAYPAATENASTRRAELVASEGFWIAETETTQRQWTAIMGTNPSAYAITGVLAKRLNGQNFRGVDFAELPVENVDWFDCRRFASDLNALGVAPDGFEFRLPTFAEGECATRAGTTTAFYWGDEPDLAQANLQPPPEPNGARRAGTPKPVRSYPPNPWGLYDAVGNAAEWRLDSFYSTAYPSEEEAAKDGFTLRGLQADGATSSPKEASWPRVKIHYRGTEPYYQGVDEETAYGFRLALAKIGAATPEERVLWTDARAPVETPEEMKKERREIRERMLQTALEQEAALAAQNVDVAWDDWANLKAGDRKTLEVGGVEYAFRYCPPGETTVAKEDGTLAKATFTQGFWTLETELTRRMWEAVCGKEKEWDGAPVENPNSPKLVEYYRSAFRLIERLNALGVAPRGFKFRLPSGSEATYARRAGTSTDYPFGNDPKKAREFGNVWAENERWTDGYVFDPDVDDPTYWEDGFLALAPVRSFKPNAWGLYDTFGNAGELCGVEFWGDYWPIVERFLGSVMRNERQDVKLGPLQVLDLADEPSSSPLARIRIFEPEGAKGGNATVAATDLRETGGVPARRASVLPEMNFADKAARASGFRLVLALDAGEREETPGERWKPGAAPGERRTFEIDGVEFAFRYCPPRTFETGNAFRPTLGAERGFWLLETETTVEAFRAFVEATGFQIDKPSWRRGDDTTLSWKNPGFEIKDDYPATCVAPEAADAFCAWAREKTGLAIRLPSVGEYAVARTADAPSVEAADEALRRSKTFENVADAALERAFGYAKPISRVDDGFARLAPVRSFKPNEWGLYDLRGNVAEITADWRYGTWNDEKFAWLLAVGGPVAGRELVGERWATNKPTVREPDVCGPRVLKNDVGFRILVECE